MMKKNYLIFLFYALLIIILEGCAGGYLYTGMSALQFKDIDYGFPTKTILKNPQISYIDEGNGNQTILLVHGLASNAGFWRYNIPELSKHYRVIAVDLPGYGKSEKGVYPYTMSFYAETLKRFLDSLKLDKIILIGHSMGGQIGITFALKYPERLNKLILADPAGIEKFSRGQGDWLKSVLTVNGIKATTEEGVRKNLTINFYTWNDKNEWMVEERVRIAKADDFDDFCYAVVRCVHGMLDEPTSDKLKDIKVPTLIIYGKEDGLIPNPYLNPGFPSDVFKAGEKQISGCRLVQIEDSGHMVMMEQPEKFDSAVLNFLQ
jgi:pimeloyl-ACP methyl ester carboxylesterase